MAQSKNMVQEMVVSLSAQIDNPGIQKIMTLLDSNRLKVMTLGAAITAATTGIYKFVASITKEEFELRQLNKTKHKQIEQLRAEQQALKTMGMTLNDIKKDKALKSMYDDLVKFNKEMAMPNMDRAMDKVNNLRGAFYKFRSAISYAMKWIGAQVITNLEAPIDRVTGKLKNAANWIRDNIHQITSKIASFITAFAKGLIGIAETVEKIVSKVNSLPSGIKAIGSAIAVVFGILSSGPLGKVLAAITLIGDVIHDYENYQWNKKNQENPEVFKANNEKGYTSDLNDPNLVMENGKPVAYQVPIALGSFYEIYDDETDTATKTRNIAKKLVEKLTGVFTDVRDILAQNDTITGLLTGDNSLIGQVFDGINTFVSSPDGKIKIRELVHSIITSIGSMMKVAGSWGGNLVGDVAELIASLLGKKGVWKDSKLRKALNGENGIVNGLIGALELNALGASPLVSIVGGIMGGWTTERDKAIEEIYKKYNNLSDKDFQLAKHNGLTISMMDKWISENPEAATELSDATIGNLADDFNLTLEAILETALGALHFTSDIVDKAITALIKGIFGSESAVTQALDGMGENNSVWKGFTSGITTWLLSGNFLAGLFVGIGEAVTAAENSEQLAQDAQAFWEMLETIWWGTVDEAHPNGTGLRSFFMKIWEGDDGNSGLKQFFVDLGDKIVEWMTPAFNKLGYLLAVALYNALESSGALNIAKWFGIDINNPNTSTISMDEDGNFIMTSTNGKSRKLTDEELAQISGTFINTPSEKGVGVDDTTVFNLSFDKDGNIVGTNGMTFSLNGMPGFLTQDGKSWVEYMWGVKELTDEMREEEKKIEEQRKAEIEEARQKREKRAEESGQKIIETGGKSTYDENGNLILTPDEKTVPIDYNEDTSTPVEFNYANGRYRVSRDSSGKFDFSTVEGLHDGGWSGVQVGVLRQFMEDDYSHGKIPELQIPVETTGEEEAAETGYQKLQSIADGKPVKYPTEMIPMLKEAYGGRIGSSTFAEIGEDGTEYVIPITRQQRAIELIMQMLNEMGSSVTEKIFSGMGLGQVGTIGANMATLSSAMNGMVMNNTYNISAPVSINVNASGASAEDIGTQAYNLAERHLVKSLRGVYA